MESLQKEALTKKIEDLLGECEVERLKNGRYIVLYMSLVSSPPPTGKTPEEAMEKFIEWYGAGADILNPNLPEIEDFSPEDEVDNADFDK